jgi:hypothetical protein
MKYIEVLLSVGLCLGLANVGHAKSAPEIKLASTCEAGSCDEDAELQQARNYLIETARPGGTMTRQGADLAIERLQPEFALRLARAIQAARQAGLNEAGIFSAYRPPVFGVGGFADKYYSLHAYGLAVDMFGIGRPGSSEAQRWHKIAADYGIVCPYGYRSRVEWNHCQPTHLQAVKSDNPLRDTITRNGPIDLERMFEVGRKFLASTESAISAVVGNRSKQVVLAVSSRRIKAMRGGSRKLQKAIPNQRRVVARTRQQQLQRKAKSPTHAKVASLVKHSKRR